MTREEAARILDPETSRDELWRYEADTRLAACDEACRMGADALRAQQERENPKPMTNADRIRDMSDEELAENRCVEIKGLYPWPIFVAFDVPEKRFLSRESAVAEELNWLQQPAEEG